MKVKIIHPEFLAPGMTVVRSSGLYLIEKREGSDLGKTRDDTVHWYRVAGDDDTRELGLFGNGVAVEAPEEPYFEWMVEVQSDLLDFLQTLAEALSDGKISWFEGFRMAINEIAEVRENMAAFKELQGNFDLSPESKAILEADFRQRFTIELANYLTNSAKVAEVVEEGIEVFFPLLYMVGPVIQWGRKVQNLKETPQN